MNHKAETAEYSKERERTARLSDHPGAPSVVLNSVCKSYDSVQVLKGLCLSIPAQSTTVILGRSGAGKSVTLKLILGTDNVDSGEIIIDGVNVSSMAPKARSKFSAKRVGMLFQSSALFDSMTIEENVAFSMTNAHLKDVHSSSDIQDIVDDALEKVGLAGFQKKFPSELSGGQKRRAALARLIVYRPKILLFDEPTTGLDPVTAMQINQLICETQKALDATCVVVTHDIVSALSVGQWFALHHDGAIPIYGNKRDFFSNDDALLRDFIKSAMVPRIDRDLLTSLGV